MGSSVPSEVELRCLERLERGLTELSGALAAAGARGEGPLPDPAAPAFGLLVIQGERERWLLLGERGFAHASPPVLPWRDSPLARVFMTHLEGEDYELALDGRLLEGRVAVRWLLRFDAGRLASVHTGSRLLFRDGSTSWRAEHRPLVDWRPPATTGPAGSRLDLDEEQRAVVMAPADATLLVEGAAGSGKTTACLHRVAGLRRDAAQDHPLEDPIVLVPERGLAELCRRRMSDLGAADVAVWPFEAWIQDRGQRCFPRLPRSPCPDTPPRVRRFFRHPALLACLPAWVEERVQGMVEELDRTLFARGALMSAWERLEEVVPAKRLRQLEARWAHGRTARERRRVRAAFGRARRDLQDPRPDWEALWQDRKLLERAAARSDGALDDTDVLAVLDHAWLQFSERSERTWAHVDPERLKTLDGLGLDEGTPHEVAGTIDREAWAVLLALHILKCGLPRPGGGPLPLHGHMVVDEIQERAAVELRVLSALRLQGGGLSMSGDRAQRVDASGDLPADEALRWSLGQRDIRHITLRHAHRSTHAIAAFCHGLLGPLAPAEPPGSHHEGPPVLRSVHSGHGEALATMAGTLSDRFDPRRELAVIAHDAERAKEIHAVLEEVAGASLVLDGRFDPRRRGVVVTCVEQVSGMEFDAVWVPDADAVTYPLRDGARRRLYVACSRARRALWVLSPGRPSRMLPEG